MECRDTNLNITPKNHFKKKFLGEQDNLLSIKKERFKTILNEDINQRKQDKNDKVF